MDFLVGASANEAIEQNLVGVTEFSSENICLLVKLQCKQTMMMK
jgi:hypothetical protein